MNYETSKKKTEELLAKAFELAEKHGVTGEEKWPFVVGCLQSDIRMILVGSHPTLYKQEQ